MAKGRIEQEIFIKIIGGKDVGELRKAIKELEKTKAELTVSADTDEARKELDAIDKQLAELKGEKAEIEVTAKVDRAINALEDVSIQAKKAEVAAEALSIALGPELAAKADIDGIISDFQRMDLSLDEITANADRLGAKLQDVGQRDIGGKLTTGFQRLDGDMRSAAGSSSVMANAIGNTTQDLFAMGGIAGTAGVALGQMGEYMADAAFSGEQLGTVLRNFGKIAGPVAAITAAIGIFSSIMGSLKAQSQAAAERTKAVGDAMAEGADDALAFSGVLRDNADALRDFTTAANDPLGNFGVQVDELMGKIPLVGGLFKEAGADIFEIAAKAELSIYDLGQAIEDGGKVGGDFTKQLLAAFDAGKITEDEYNALSAAVVEYGASTVQAAADLGLFNVDQKELNALLQEMLKQRRPLAYFTDQWSILMDDMRDGKIDTQQAADAVNFLVQQLGLAPDVIRDIAQARLDEEMAASTAALKENAEAAEEWGRTVQEAATQAAIDLADAQGAIDDMGSVFNEMARREGAIEAAFTLGNAPIEALEAVVDVNEAIRDLGKFIEEEGVPNIFDPNDVDAEPFLAAISSLRGPIQDAVATAFAAGGPAAAQATADSYVQQIVASMRGQLDEGQVRQLLGLGDLEATLKIAVDQESLAEAQAMLEVLTGLRGATPWAAEIQLALAGGQLSPQAASVLIARQLEGVGVEVPAALLPPDQKSRDAALAEANRWAAEPGHEVGMESNVNDPKLRSLIEARLAGEAYAQDHPIRWPVQPVGPRGPFSSVFDLFDQGGTVDGVGGVAGERGPEILDGRYLTAGPTYVPPGTRVTSRRRTAVVLRSHGTRGLRRYDSGGVVPFGPINVNIRAGVIGNRYETMRAVDRGIRDGIRLRGNRA